MKIRSIGMVILFVVLLGFLSQVSAQAAIDHFTEHKDSLIKQPDWLLDSEGNKVRYIFQEGESPDAFADRIGNGITLEDLIKWNGSAEDWEPGDTFFARRPSEVANELFETISLSKSPEEILDPEVFEEEYGDDIIIDEPDEEPIEEPVDLVEEIDTLSEEEEAEDITEDIIGYRILVSLGVDRTMGTERNKIFPVFTTEISHELRAKGLVFF